MWIYGYRQATNVPEVFAAVPDQESTVSVHEQVAVSDVDVAPVSDDEDV